MQWTGLFDTKYENQLLNLKQYFTPAELSKVNGVKWSCVELQSLAGSARDAAREPVLHGLLQQGALQEGGRHERPDRTGSQLFAACTKLKAAGITPIVYGADPQAIGPNPYPFYDLSYIAAGLYSPAQLKGLYTGQIPWTSPAMVKQVTTWASMPKRGLHEQRRAHEDEHPRRLHEGAGGDDHRRQLGHRDAAPGVSGRRSRRSCRRSPASRRTGVVQYSGDGFAVSKQSSHPKEAVEFLKFLMTPRGAAIIAAAGLIPDVQGFSATNPLANQMLAFAKSGQGCVPDDRQRDPGRRRHDRNKQLDAALGGNISAAAALKSMRQTHDSPPCEPARIRLPLMTGVCPREPIWRPCRPVGRQGLADCR